MKHLKLFENFRVEEIDEFMSVIRDKVLELSDIGFSVKVEDKNSEPLLENMIRITIKKESRKDFNFSDVADISADILLTNIQMGLYKNVHVIATPSWREDRRSSGSVRLSCVFSDDECIWSYEEQKVKNMTSLNPIDLDCRLVELFFE